jgi:hypothetical protein
MRLSGCYATRERFGVIVRVAAQWSWTSVTLRGSSRHFIQRKSMLSFISRHHLQGRARIPGLLEVPVKGVAMRRRLVETYRANGFLSPAARRLLAA